MEWFRQLYGRRPELVTGCGVLLAQCLASIGIWNADVPLGDEGSHILRAYAVSWNPRSWTSPFHTTYALALGITHDPVVAHLLMRFLLAEVTALVLYCLLRAMGLSRQTSTMASIAWIGCGVGNQLIQDGNINLFCFSLAGAGLAFALSRRNHWGFAACGVSWSLASASRPEYLLPLMVLVGAVVVGWLRRSAAVMRGAIAFGLGAVAAWVVFRVDVAKLDSYLLLGLGQCYASYFLRHHPGALCDPFTAYQSLLDNVFGAPHSLVAAIGNNPYEFARYIALNGLSNLVRLIPSLVNPRHMAHATPGQLLRTIPAAVTYLALLVGLYMAMRQRRMRNADRQAIAWVLVLTSSASLAIALLVPTSRYWIACAPLTYYFVGIAAESLCATLLPRARYTALIICATFFLWPMPWGKIPGRETISAVRSAAISPAPTIVGATFPHPFVAFSLHGRGEGVYLVPSHRPLPTNYNLEPRRKGGRDTYLREGATTESCLRSACDVVIINDSLGECSEWRGLDSVLALLDQKAGWFALAYSEGGTQVYRRIRRASDESRRVR